MINKWDIDNNKCKRINIYNLNTGYYLNVQKYFQLMGSNNPER